MAENLRESIRVISDLLRKQGPDYPDRIFYQQMLDEQYKELARLQENRPSQPTTYTRPPDVPSKCSRPTHKYSFI